MKQKIAIFGDSYADGFETYKIFPENLPWVGYLKQNSKLEVKNFAVQGSSFDYSAKLFFENYKNFDKVIFVVTTPGRFFLSDPKVDKELVHIANLDHLFWRIDTYKKYIDKALFDCTNNKLDYAMPYLNALREYYLYLYDFDKVKMYHDALYEKIKNSMPSDALLTLPTNCYSTPDATGIVTLADISEFDKKPKIGSDKMVMDIRLNHLNKNNRIMLSEKVYQWIETSHFKLTHSDILEASEPLEELFSIVDQPKDFKKI